MAIRRSLGIRSKDSRVAAEANARARGLGSQPNTFRISQTAAYSSRFFMRRDYAGRAKPRASAGQYIGAHLLTNDDADARLASSSMDEPSQAPSQSHLAPAAKIGWAALIVVTLYVCYFSHLGALGFVGPDEPRYAWVAREMLETGDWVTPRLYGKPWFEKPVLYYWGAALSFKLFGVSEAAARLPSAVSALLATLALAWLAWRIYGAETARWLLLLLPTTVGMIGFSHAAAMDMPFTGVLTVAMVAAAVMIGLTRPPTAPSPSSPRPHSATPWLALVIFGVFLGAAVLAKGPAAIILCGGAVFFWALFTRRWRDSFRLLHPAAITSFCVTALPWYILCARRNPDFFRVFIIEHNFRRYVTPEFHHIQPFWFYVPVLLAGLFPWVGMTIAAAGDLLKRKPRVLQRDSSSLLFLAFVLFPLVFFSLSKSKLPGYILPAIPPASLLTCSYLLAELPLTGSSRSKRVGLSAFALTPLALIATSSLSLYFVFREQAPHAFVLAGGLLAVLGVNVCIAFALTHRWRALVLSGILACVIGVEVINQTGLPWLGPHVSPRAVAAVVQRNPEDADRVLAFRLRRGSQYALNFYLHRELKDWDIAGHGPALVFVPSEGIVELRNHKFTYTIVDSTCQDALLVQIGELRGPGGTGASDKRVRLERPSEDSWKRFSGEAGDSQHR